MTRNESSSLFDEIRDYLHNNGFKNKLGKDIKYNYRGDYMLFNCPHMCSSVRLFKVNEDGSFKLVEDIRTSFGKSYEDNRLLAFDFINKVIQRLNDEDNNGSV